MPRNLKPEDLFEASRQNMGLLGADCPATLLTEYLALIVQCETSITTKKILRYEMDGKILPLLRGLRRRELQPVEELNKLIDGVLIH